MVGFSDCSEANRNKDTLGNPIVRVLIRHWEYVPVQFAPEQPREPSAALTREGR